MEVIVTDYQRRVNHSACVLSVLNISDSVGGDEAKIREIIKAKWAKRPDIIEKLEDVLKTLIDRMVERNHSKQPDGLITTSNCETRHLVPISFEQAKKILENAANDSL